MTNDGFYLFTYGSLKEATADGPGRALLAGCERVGEGTVAGTLYDMGDYPALLLDGPDRVDGVIWRCPVDRLEALDSYEAVAAGLFRRVAVQVDQFPCWIYVAGPRLGPRLVPEARVRRWEKSTWRRRTSS